MTSICKDCKHKNYCDETVRLYGLKRYILTECKEYERKEEE